MEKKVTVSPKNEGKTAESENRLVALINGGKPKTEDEKVMAAEIKKIVDAGQVPYIPTSL